MGYDKDKFIYFDPEDKQPYMALDNKVHKPRSGKRIGLQVAVILLLIYALRIIFRLMAAYDDTMVPVTSQLLLIIFCVWIILSVFIKEITNKPGRHSHDVSKATWSQLESAVRNSRMISWTKNGVVTKGTLVKIVIFLMFVGVLLGFSMGALIFLLFFAYNNQMAMSRALLIEVAISGIVPGLLYVVLVQNSPYRWAKTLYNIQQNDLSNVAADEEE